MKNNTQGFTLIELLIVIAIIGILAAVLVPNLIGAQKRAYDTSALSCGKSLQTLQAMWQVDNKTYGDIATGKITQASDGMSQSCKEATLMFTQATAGGLTDYKITVWDTRGKNAYEITPNDVKTVEKPSSGGAAIPAT